MVANKTVISKRLLKSFNLFNIKMKRVNKLKSEYGDSKFAKELVKHCTELELRNLNNQAGVFSYWIECLLENLDES